MVRRWLIRSFFLTLLLLWATGWAISTRYDAWGSYVRGGMWLATELEPGKVGFTWDSGAPVADGWHGRLASQPFHLVGSGFWWYHGSFTDADATRSSFSLMGFSYDHVRQSRAPGPPRLLLTVTVPFWFLLLVSGLALHWAWRKTRPQPSPATAFPVEPVVKHD